MPEFRGTRGRRYPLAAILAIAAAAKLAGYHGVTAFAEFAKGLTQHQLRALRAFYSGPLGRFTTPSATAFFKVLVALDPEVLDRAARAWAAQQSRDEPVAIDGKCIRGAARHNPGAKHHLVAAVEHRSGVVLAQEAVADKSNEIPIVRTLPPAPRTQCRTNARHAACRSGSVRRTALRGRGRCGSRRD